MEELQPPAEPEVLTQEEQSFSHASEDVSVATCGFLMLVLAGKENGHEVCWWNVNVLA